MAKKSTKKTDEQLDIDTVASIEYQPITDTIEKNYMPYVMTVIISRAIPEIDGLKPSHRKLLYTMYKMGLLTGDRTKSANVVGQTMKLNPHGDMAIYDTLVRLTRGNAALLHPLVDSKGSFGKQYSSSDMKCAAPRYTEVKLDAICNELFKGIDKDSVDFIDNYDGSMKEPVLLPTTFPNVLVMPNTGIAVGMASSICSFNLNEVCDATIAVLKNPKTDIDTILDIMPAPDFSGGGSIIYDREQMKSVYETGSGPVRIRSRYNYDKDANCIDIIQIPYSTSIELIIKRITELVKTGKLKEINDFRDEIDINGFKLTIDLKKGVDPDKLMSKLFKITPLEDSFKCNFNILIDARPRQMGVLEIITEWIRFRTACFTRELRYDLAKKYEKLHLLKGLAELILDIDKAIDIIRNTKKESDVVPNLMNGFNIDEVQAEYIAEIKLRNINREYLLNRTMEMENLLKEIARTEDILADSRKFKALLISQLLDIKKKYGQPRMSQIIHSDDIKVYSEEEHIENYNVRLVLSREGYFKKITLLSLRGNDEQKFKDGDSLRDTIDSENKSDIFFFTDARQVYRARVMDFDNTKASAMGDFLPAKLNMDTGEKPIFMRAQSDYPASDNMVFIFENGKGVRVPVSAYETKGNRRKLVGAYSDASPIVAVFYEKEAFDILMVSSAGRAIVIKSSLITQKTTRTSAGVTLFNLKEGQKIIAAMTDFEDKLPVKGLKKIKIPATGIAITPDDIKALGINS